MWKISTLQSKNFGYTKDNMRIGYWRKNEHKDLRQLNIKTHHIMTGKTSFGRTLFFYFFIVFIFFTTAMAAFQYHREKQHKTRELEQMLGGYASFVSSYIQHQKDETREIVYSRLDSMVNILPRKDIRITIVTLDGEVIYDSFDQHYHAMENHGGRPEIQQARYDHRGSNIRKSATTNQEFYYYAEKYDDYYVRAAVLYGINIRNFLQAEVTFLYFILILFFITSGIMMLVSRKAVRSVVQLKDFALKAGRNEPIPPLIQFPENELGTIGKQIVGIYKKLKKTNQDLNNEKEKLIHHLQLSQEGVAFFSKNHEKILASNFFIQHLNIIAPTPTLSASDFLNIEAFRPAKDFLSQHLNNDQWLHQHTLPVKRFEININNRYFHIQCIIFHDKSYEISIHDVTRSEKQKQLKQQMTSNIAHELRTPVSSIKAFLETLIANGNIPEEKQKHFLQKAALQTERLSELVRDISILTKMEEASDAFEMENVNIMNLVKDVEENLQWQIDNANAKLEYTLNPKTTVWGSRILLYSVFQNLMENSLRYGGTNVVIKIEEYLKEQDYVYYAFSDNGTGIPEKHQNRVFERFYRIDQGRARTIGGS